MHSRVAQVIEGDGDLCKFPYGSSWADKFGGVDTVLHWLETMEKDFWGQYHPFPLYAKWQGPGIWEK